MKKKKLKRYDLTLSPLYKLKSKAKLADMLYISKKQLLSLTDSSSFYYSFELKEDGRKPRNIDAPKQQLKDVQSRLADLLQRIAPPDYLFTPVKGRSYVDNAAVHTRSNSFRLLDIADYFPSCKAERIGWFFRERLNCSLDVAAILRDISCLNGSLPQGSPCSPVLAYLSYSDMWDEIDRKVKANRCYLSVYADDISISGDKVPELLAWEVKKSLFKHGHVHNKKKERKKHLKPVEITGVIVRDGALQPPNRTLEKLHASYELLDKTSSEIEAEKLLRQIRGRKSQINQIQKLST